MSADEIRKRVKSGVLSADDALPLVEQALQASTSPELWVLRGDLIQLADAPPYDLSEAARSYG